MLVVRRYVGSSSKLPSKTEVIASMRKANDYFMQKWPDTGKPIVTNKTRPSNIWTRAVYYEGLMDLYKVDPQQRYIDYAVAWGESHKWGLRSGLLTHNADDQCCGQTYIDLYMMDKKPERIRDIKANMDSLVKILTVLIGHGLMHFKWVCQYLLNWVFCTKTMLILRKCTKCTTTQKR
jgi:rhamnogalacturonyl hydrolase YesR